MEKEIKTKDRPIAILCTEYTLYKGSYVINLDDVI